MRKKYNTPHRSRVVKTRLSEDEYADFTARLAPYGISQSEFLRQAIRRTAIRPIIHVSAVNDELLSAVGKLTAEYGRIGGNLNQIAQKAHVLGVIDERRYDEEMRKFDQLVRDITKAVILPRAMDTKGSPRSLLRGEKEHPRSGEPFDACGKSGKRSAV